MNVLLLGLGRMGQRYERVLHQLSAADLRLWTVDPKAPAQNSLAHYESLSEVPTSIQFDLAIDARPNQNRFDTLRAFGARKIPRVIVEKPSAASMEESQNMVAYMHEQGASMQALLPFYLRYAEPYANRALLEEIGAGPLRFINITAGAIGLGCNGVHYIDFAAFLFGSKPSSVLASLELNSIKSPRGEQFLDHSGTLNVKFPNGEFVLSIIPDSSCGVNTILVFERGKIVISEQAGSDWRWYRQPEKLMGEPYFRACQEEEMTPPKPFAMDMDAMMREAISRLLQGAPVPSLDEGHLTLSVIAAAVESSNVGRRIDLSEDERLRKIEFNFT